MHVIPKINEMHDLIYDDFIELRVKVKVTKSNKLEDSANTYPVVYIDYIAYKDTTLDKMYAEDYLGTIEDYIDHEGIRKIGIGLAFFIELRPILAETVFEKSFIEEPELWTEYIEEMNVCESGFTIWKDAFRDFTVEELHGLFTGRFKATFDYLHDCAVNFNRKS